MAAPQRDYDMTVYPIQAAVRSQHDGARSYTVTLPHCPCPDFTNRRGQLIPVEVDEHIVAVTVCKHIAEALARIGGWHRPEPEVFENLTRHMAVEVLRTKAELQGRVVSAALLNVQPGAPQQLPRTGKPAAIVTVTGTRGPGTRRYTVTIPQ